LVRHEGILGWKFGRRLPETVYWGPGILLTGIFRTRLTLDPVYVPAAMDSISGPIHRPVELGIGYFTIMV